MVRFETGSKDEIKIEKKEVLRYLGYKEETADKAVEKLIWRCIEEIWEKLTPKACYEELELKENEDLSLSIGEMVFFSKDLRKNLKGCSRVYLFCATVGLDVDRIIQKYSLTEPSYAVTAQAVGAVAIENWCNILCNRLERISLEKGDYLRPRFSPGYGDFELKNQKKIFERLECERKIGVFLTEGCLMIPTKSVSAIVGISKDKTDCIVEGCENCEKKNCEFRRS